MRFGKCVSTTRSSERYPPFRINWLLGLGNGELSGDGQEHHGLALDNGPHRDRSLGSHNDRFPLFKCHSEGRNFGLAGNDAQKSLRPGPVSLKMAQSQSFRIPHPSREPVASRRIAYGAQAHMVPPAHYSGTSHSRSRSALSPLTPL